MRLGGAQPQGGKHPVLTDGSECGSPAQLRRKTLPASVCPASQSARWRNVTHCRVTVWVPGIGRSISRSRRLQTTNTRYLSRPSPGGSPIPPHQSCPWPVLQTTHMPTCVRSCGLCEVMWSVGAQICWFRDSRTHTFPVEPTSLSPTCPFLLTGVQIMSPSTEGPCLWTPSWSPHLTNRDSNLSLRLHLSPNSDSSAQ